MNRRLSGVAIGLVFFSVSCAESAAPSSAAPTADEIAASEPSTPEVTSEPAATSTTTPAGRTGPSASCRGDGEELAVGRTDVRPSGNRHALGTIDLLNVAVARVELPDTPEWIVPFIAEDDDCEPRWYVVLESATAVIVDPDGNVTDAGVASIPPESSPGVVSSAYDDHVLFDGPLPDSRVVSFGRWTVALVIPTDRYAHGVLGDRIEAAGIEILDTESGERTQIVIDAPTVIEGISPMLIDVDQRDEAAPEILVTLSNSDDGAWLALYNIDGTLRARSDAIGRGNRWRNQLGAAWTGSGNFEIVDVRTPHLDGVVEFFQLVDDRLERVAATSGYTSHVIGSRNLDMGILVDADIDKAAEVVLPTRDLGSLAVIDRAGDEAIELGRIELGGSLNTNIATQWITGQAWLAVGTSDGTLLVFGEPRP